MDCGVMIKNNESGIDINKSREDLLKETDGLLITLTRDHKWFCLAIFIATMPLTILFGLMLPFEANPFIFLMTIFFLLIGSYYLRSYIDYYLYFIVIFMMIGFLMSFIDNMEPWTIFLFPFLSCFLIEVWTLYYYFVNKDELNERLKNEL
jgi:hypothetical protein